MNTKCVILIHALLLSSGCSKQQFSTKKQFSELQQNTKHNLTPDFLLQPELYEKLQITEHKEVRQLSRKDAIKMALMYNPSLQASFHKLGIANADLVQAGLFTNPAISSLFRIPKSPTDKPNIEIDAPVFNLVEFWQIPLAKRVAEDELEITTKDILEHILSIYTDTKIAYDTCLLFQAKYELITHIINEAQQLLDWVEYRYQFGYETKLDIKLTHIQLKNWQSDRAMYYAKLHNAFSELTTLLGVHISSEPFNLTDTLLNELTEENFPLLHELEQLAMHNRPEIQMQEFKVNQAYHRISLERSKILKDASIGVSYKLDFEDQRGTGPLFNVQVPLFDWNQAQIKRARVDADMQEKLLLSIKREVRRDVQVHHASYIAELEQISLHKDALHLYQEAIDFVKLYEGKMMFSRTVVFETIIQSFQEQMALIDRHFNARVSFTLLEKTIGKKLSIEPLNESPQRI